MIGRTKQLHETLVDGIPTFFVETGQTLRATLSFRVGMTDEVLAATGSTHLAEHLAMHDLQQPSVLSNATVGGCGPRKLAKRCLIAYHRGVSDTARDPGALVRARRMRLGLSQRAAAHVCGIPQSMLSRIESGQTQPSVTTLLRVLDRLGADLHLELRSPETGGEGRREKQRSLWLNRLVVGELSRDPDRVLAIARDNIARWRDIHAGRLSILAGLDRWSEILDEGVESVVATLTGQSEEAEDLRQNSPFAGVLSQEQREQALASFRSHWEHRQAAAAVAMVETSLAR